MIINYVTELDDYEADDLPSGAIISFGSFNWERVGDTWMRSRTEEPDTLDDLDLEMDSEEMCEVIASIMENNPDVYPQFSVIVPEDAYAFSSVMWKEEDIESVFGELGVECTSDLYDKVESKLIRKIDDAMTETGWSLIRAAVDAVLSKEKKK